MVMPAGDNSRIGSIHKSVSTVAIHAERKVEIKEQRGGDSSKL